MDKPAIRLKMPEGSCLTMGAACSRRKPDSFPENWSPCCCCRWQPRRGLASGETNETV